MKVNVAVVIPVYKQYADLDLIEKISLEQTCKAFQAYDICFVTHTEINTSLYCDNHSTNLSIKRFNFDKSYFANIPGYNRLLLDYNFYKAFDEYTYMLICQLDVFVFSDKLAHFLQMDYDYIGGPWFENYTLATENSKIIGAGNGGFSLRKIASFLSVLGITRFFNRSYLDMSHLKDISLNPISFISILKFSRSRNRSNSSKSIFPWEFLSNDAMNEDTYWSDVVNQHLSWFKVGDVKDSVSFAFEVNPQVLYKLNNYELPMAVHAWHKYDTNFWKPFIEERGYNLDQY